MQLDYYFPNVVVTEFEKSNSANKFREKHELGNSFIVGSAGTISDRKGADLWLEVCRLVSKETPEVKFCWIGEFENESYKSEVFSRIEDNKLQNNVLFTGALKYDVLNFSPFNIFLLSSKEDTYPLVVLEAALLKIPTLCYENSGGIPEFVKNDSGWVIDGFSVELAAKQIIELYNASGSIEEKGENAFRQVIEKHCNKARVIEQFNEIVKIAENSY
jgi:glycosyltransferase involved in cell wall biosynthesis